MPTFHEIMAAHKVIRSYIHETPTYTSNNLREMTHHDEIIFKCENLQRTGSYKFRGAIYAVMRAKEDDIGVNHFVAHCNSDHGQAVALAASSFSAESHIVMAEDTDEVWVTAVKQYGGQVVLCEPSLAARKETARKIVEKYASSARYIHSHDDERIIAGNGTAGVELMLQTDCNLDAVVVPVGGGSLLAGVAIAVKGMRPNIAVFGAEPDIVDSSAFRRYYEKRLAKPAAATPPPAATAAASGSTILPKDDKHLNAKGEEVKQYIDSHVNGIIRVTDAEVRHAFRLVLQRCKLMIDLQAATAVAAVLAKPAELQRYKRIGIILSGGNVLLPNVPKFGKL